MLVLRHGPILANVRTVAAAISLARRGIGLLKAKRAIEEMLTSGRTVVFLPTVESLSGLVTELADSGIETRMLEPADVDPKALRKRLGLTQEQFALRFGIDIDALQNWETRRRRPDAAARSYLKVIENLPERASEALEVDVPLGAAAAPALEIRNGGKVRLNRAPPKSRRAPG